ncbi:MAG: Uma2 family endonuclease, partial [Chloroflexota bacterium]|nr:Uma2 family endonuclease [Chloroflexota bacterium]
MSNYEMELAEASESEDEEDEPMPTAEHSFICANLITELNIFLRGKNLGWIFDSTLEYRFPNENKAGKKVSRYPDVSFVQQEHLPDNIRSYLKVAPDLVVEVISPSDKDYDIDDKVDEYQRSGVRLIWVIHPASRTVDVYQIANGPKSQRYIGEEELEGGDVIPGFKLKVSAIFNYPLPPKEIGIVESSSKE